MIKPYDSQNHKAFTEGYNNKKYLKKRTPIAHFHP